ncbi:unnamed protein product [Anisakis simplex]|uniref:Uncharacterized protein n=1 Tax=Anisakis simplex TaxID=6269 RepID=A0A0M3JJD4_ANISI|nr:unnamed protein product [Anisakis simplex]
MSSMRSTLVATELNVLNRWRLQIYQKSAISI